MTNDLKERIKTLRSTKKILNNQAHGLNVATDLVAGCFVGIVTGFFIDKLFDSKPLFTIICFVIGIVSAFKNIWRKMK